MGRTALKKAASISVRRFMMRSPIEQRAISAAPQWTWQKAERYFRKIAPIGKSLAQYARSGSFMHSRRRFPYDRESRRLRGEVNRTCPEVLPIRAGFREARTSRRRL